MPHLKRLIKHVQHNYCCELLALAARDRVETTPKNQAMLVDTIKQLSKRDRQAYYDLARRIDQMTDDMGQELMARLVRNKSTFDSQYGPYNQAAWLFLHEPAMFEQAENERFADIARYGSRWDSFKVLTEVNQSPDLQTLKRELVRYFGYSDEVLVELFERQRVCIDGSVEELQQVMVYREGVPSLLKEVSPEQDSLQESFVKPAREYAFLWNAEKSELEVISRKKNEREQLACLFTSYALGILLTPEKIKKRALTLNALKEKPLLPFSRDEGIEKVSVTFLKLESQDKDGSFAIRSPSRKGLEKDVYQVVRENNKEVLLVDQELTVVEASIAVQYRQRPGERRARGMTIELKHPCSSNLHDLTEMERHLSWNKLKEWGLTHD